MTNQHAETTLITSNTEFFHLCSKDTGKFLGVFTLETRVKEHSFIFQGEKNIEANLTIFLNFYSKEYNYEPMPHCWFNACYHNKTYLGRKPRASISTHDPLSTGGIELKPINIHGQRVGGLVMSKIITWLKTYPLETTVNGINFKPGGNAKAIAKFYENAGIPIDGSTTTIGKLKVNESWKKNIKMFTLHEFQCEIIDLQEQILFSQNQYDVLDKQYSSISKLANTTNPFKALKSFYTEPTIIERHTTPNSNHELPIESDYDALMGKYIHTQIDLDKWKQEIQYKLNGISFINESKHPDKKWENFFQSLILLANYWKNYIFVFTVIFIIASLYYFPKLNILYTFLAFSWIAYTIYRFFNPKY